LPAPRHCQTSKGGDRKLQGTAVIQTSRHGKINSCRRDDFVYCCCDVASEALTYFAEWVARSSKPT
jgi:hypothetical protein